MLLSVPSTYPCFHRARTVDVTLEVKDSSSTATTNAGDAETNDCLVKTFAAMKATGTFTAKVRLVSKPDPGNARALQEALASLSPTHTVPADLGSGSGGAVGLKTSPSPPATTAKPSTATPNPMDPINKIMKAHAGQFRTCYLRELDKNPAVAGKLNYHVDLNASGVVTRVKLRTSTMRSTDVEACIARQLMSLKFPANAKPSFDYPFVFQPPQ